MDPEETREGAAVSARLALFAPGGDPARRRRRLVFAAVYAAVALLLVWPVYPLFSGTLPLILGLPLSLAWVVLALAVMFGALLWLFRSDERGEDG